MSEHIDGGAHVAATSPAQQVVSAPATAQPTPNAAEVQAFDWGKVGLNSDASGYVANKGWKDPSDLLGSYRNLEKLAGVPAERLVQLPEGGDAEGWDQVYKKLGRPETPDGYTLPVPQGDSGDFAKTAAQWFHKAGVSATQADKLATQWNEYAAAQGKAASDARDQSDADDVQALKGEWGGAYDAKAAIVERAADAFGMTQEQLIALKTAMGPSAAMKFMHNIGAKVAVEDTGLVGADTGGTGFRALTPESAKAQIAQLTADRGFQVKFSSTDAQTRGEARALMKRLHVAAYPEA